MTPTELRAARAALGMTQRQLAEQLGVTQATVWRWESGAHPIEHPLMLHLALLRLRDEGEE